MFCPEKIKSIQTNKCRTSRAGLLLRDRVGGCCPAEGSSTTRPCEKASSRPWVNNEAQGEAGTRSGRVSLTIMQIACIKRAKSTSAISVLPSDTLTEVWNEILLVRRTTGTGLTPKRVEGLYLSKVSIYHVIWELIQRTLFYFTSAFYRH